MKPTVVTNYKFAAGASSTRFFPRKDSTGDSAKKAGVDQATKRCRSGPNKCSEKLVRSAARQPCCGVEVVIGAIGSGQQIRVTIIEAIFIGRWLTERRAGREDQF